MINDVQFVCNILLILIFMFKVIVLQLLKDFDFFFKQRVVGCLKKYRLVYKYNNNCELILFYCFKFKMYKNILDYMNIKRIF